MSEADHAMTEPDTVQPEHTSPRLDDADCRDVSQGQSVGPVDSHQPDRRGGGAADHAARGRPADHRADGGRDGLDAGGQRRGGGAAGLDAAGEAALPDPRRRIRLFDEHARPGDRHGAVLRRPGPRAKLGQAAQQDPGEYRSGAAGRDRLGRQAHRDRRRAHRQPDAVQSDLQRLRAAADGRGAGDSSAGGQERRADVRRRRPARGRSPCTCRPERMTGHNVTLSRYPAGPAGGQRLAAQRRAGAGGPGGPAPGGPIPHDRRGRSRIWS